MKFLGSLPRVYNCPPRPTALRHAAQGCAKRYPGNRDETPAMLKGEPQRGFRPSSKAGGRSRDGAHSEFPNLPKTWTPLTQDCANPGLHDGSPLGFTLRESNLPPATPTAQTFKSSNRTAFPDRSFHCSLTGRDDMICLSASTQPHIELPSWQAIRHRRRRGLGPKVSMTPAMVI